MKQLKTARISNIEKIQDKKRVIDITVDGNHNFVTKGNIVVHNCNSTQPALRGFIEKFSKSARFILTANYKDKIIEPLQNRLIDFDFDVIFKENPGLIKNIYLMSQKILEDKDIEYDSQDLKYLVKNYYPSLRDVVNKIQQFTFTDKLVINKESLDSEGLIDKLINNVINNEFEDMRKNASLLTDPGILYTDMYTRLDNFPIEKRPPVLLCIAKYQSHDGLVRDRVVNAAACCTELMGIIRAH